MSTTVRTYNFETQEARTIPAAELAPGMAQAQVPGVGLVWVKVGPVLAKSQSQPLKHPPFDQELKTVIKGQIMKPLRQVRPLTLVQWEEGFRRDDHPEKEIAIWCRIADRFKRFSTSEQVNLWQRHEAFKVMLTASTCSPEHVLEVVALNALSRDQAQRGHQSIHRADLGEYGHWARP